MLTIWSAFEYAQRTEVAGHLPEPELIAAAIIYERDSVRVALSTTNGNHWDVWVENGSLYGEC